MNKKDLKRNLIALSLGATIALNSTGCATSNTPTSEAESTSMSDEEKTYNTKDYYLIYLDGNFYLTTRTNFNYVIGSYYNTTYTYYDVITGECVGTEIGYCISERTSKKLYDVQLFDYDFNNGLYGYGNNIPSMSIMSVSNFIASEEFTSQEFDFLSSNSIELHKMIKDLVVLNTISIADEYKVNEDFIYKDVNLARYECTLSDGTIDTLLGYRCSYNSHDLGYLYIYDILTGNIKYIGSNKHNSYVDVKAYKYENSDTWSTLISKFNETQEPKIKSEDLLIMDTETIKDAITEEYELCFISDNSERIYVLANTFKKTPDTNSLIYQDVFNDAEAWIDDSLLALNYTDYNKNVIIDFYQSSTSRPCLKTINTYLKEIGKEDLIKEEYTLEEISAIKDLLKQNNSRILSK